MNEAQILEQLAESAIFRDYERAFAGTMGMPLELRPVENWNLAHHGRRQENPFCAMMAASSPTCAACLESQKRISNPEVHQPQSTICHAGLREAAVPVRAGERLLGFLQTGEVIVGQPNQRQFAKTARWVRASGAKLDLRKLREAYFHTQTMTPKQYDSVLRLLAIFAQHLGLVANQLTMRARHAEPVAVTKVRRYLEEHHQEPIALRDVARVAGMSTFYFCKIFRKATGHTFTDYLNCLRIEKARQMLARPHMRISEAAFEAGFQSLTHFNRSFQRVLGESPTEYRAALPR